jgi:hypothetical protein
MKIDWTKQHCGVHQATIQEFAKHMPEVASMVVETFPEYADDFIWDVKVHMLMPGQYPCIPNWHYDNIPRVNNEQDFSLIRPDLPMYLWISGGPLTEFRDRELKAQEWFRFTQEDEHRGVECRVFCWRGFIRGTHKGLMPTEKRGHNPLRRHSQVYLDANKFKW